MTILPAPEARHIVLHNAPSMLRGRPYHSPAPEFPEIEPVSLRKRTIDWRCLLGGRSIVEVSACASPAEAVTVCEAYWDGAVTTLVLADGMPCTRALLAVTIVLDDGQMLTRGIVQPIGPWLPGQGVTVNGEPIEMPGLVLPPPAAITANGLPIEIPGVDLPFAGAT